MTKSTWNNIVCFQNVMWILVHNKKPEIIWTLDKRKSMKAQKKIKKANDMSYLVLQW